MGAENVDVQAPVRTAFLMIGAHTRHTDAPWSYAEHEHHYFELVFLDAGIQQIALAERVIVQEAGDIVLIAPNEAHTFATRGPARLHCVHFDVDDLELRRQLCTIGTGIITSESARFEKMRGLIAAIAGGVGPADASALAKRLHASSALFALLSLLVECTPSIRNKEAAQLSAPAFEMTARLAKMIERQVDLGEAETSIDSASREMGYSADYASANFRQVFGMSAGQYRSALKLKRAKLLLLDTHLSIADIGIKLGYSDGTHFSRQFKRWTGLVPNAFRTRHRDPE